METYGPHKIDPYRLGDFFRQYIETAIWSSDDWDDMKNDNPTPMDRKHSIDDISHSTLSAMLSDCERFQEENERALYLACNDRFNARYDRGKAGHDFWLTRHHHGAGFLDRGLRLCLGDILTKAAQRYKDMDLWVKDGKIYHG